MSQRWMKWPIIMAVAFVVPLVACQMIVGIDDHVDDSTCFAYCDVTVNHACNAQHNRVYRKMETCLGVCKNLPKGSPNEFGNENTVACRADQASQAAQGREAALCANAGPGGAGVCGTNCGSYCALMKVTCPTEFRSENGDDLAVCEGRCAALIDTVSFDVDDNYSNDSIQCRLVHLSSASVSDAEAALHCPHATLRPSAACGAVADAAPDCNDFCRVNEKVCKDAVAVYESVQQCKAVCQALPAGTNEDADEKNTMGCRRRHMYNALLYPPAEAPKHCAHTGPAGDGHCGAPETGNCESYCLLAKQGCGAAFDAAYTTQDACQKECNAQPPEFGTKRDSGYAWRMVARGTLQCRLLHAARAVTNLVTAADNTAECQSVFGAGECAPVP